MTQIAILGGAFDPITKGHTQIANLILASPYGIDEVWVLPCYRHVYDKKMTDAQHRLAMSTLACGRNARIRVSDYEIRSKAIRGTYYLLKDLLDEPFVKNTKAVSMIIGQDNANTIDKWIEYDKLTRLVRFIVVPRQGIAELPGAHWYDSPPHVRLADDGSVMDVSSTIVRSLIRDRKFDEVKNFIDEPVFTYIMEHNLYAR